MTIKENKKKKMKEEAIKPSMVEFKGDSNTLKSLKELGTDIKNNLVNVNTSDDKNYYKQVVDKLFDNKDIELKTEYLSPPENFLGAKLSFLGNYGDIPFLCDFVETFERKRVSLMRKGRQEIIMALHERRREEQEEKQRNLMSMFGMG